MSGETLYAKVNGTRIAYQVSGQGYPLLLLHGFPRTRRLWENWSTLEDVESLDRWQEVFGTDFQSVLAFAYNVTEPRYRSLFDDLFEHRGRVYGFVAVRLAEYRSFVRVRSASWKTVSIPSRAFHELRRPLYEFL